MKGSRARQSAEAWVMRNAEAHATKVAFIAGEAEGIQVIGDVSSQLDGVKIYTDG